MSDLLEQFDTRMLDATIQGIATHVVRTLKDTPRVLCTPSGTASCAFGKMGRVIEVHIVESPKNVCVQNHRFELSKPEPESKKVRSTAQKQSGSALHRSEMPADCKRIHVIKAGKRIHLEKNANCSLVVDNVTWQSKDTEKSTALVIRCRQPSSTTHAGFPVGDAAGGVTIPLTVEVIEV